jgi:hypothetical protein
VGFGCALSARRRRHAQVVIKAAKLLCSYTSIVNTPGLERERVALRC